jgi:hypothetical protein
MLSVWEDRNLQVSAEDICTVVEKQEGLSLDEQHSNKVCKLENAKKSRGRFDDTIKNHTGLHGMSNFDF